MYGLFGGVDYALPESTGLKVGAALGYSRYSIFSESLSDMQGQANTYQAALYGAWQNRHFHVGVSGRYGYTNMRSQRTLTSFGSLTADARFSGQEYGGMIEVGATLGNPTFFAVRPVAAFRYDRFTQGSFRENGAPRPLAGRRSAGLQLPPHHPRRTRFETLHLGWRLRDRAGDPGGLDLSSRRQSPTGDGHVLQRGRRHSLPHKRERSPIATPSGWGPGT